ncbi:MAG TPA: phosphopantetheine-binding protein [Candidatus Nitrosocosmicus sp.]|nr:phosphopantetheine-binding protein [Candidatus Nitrosocosmicus sp.]
MQIISSKIVVLTLLMLLTQTNCSNKTLEPPKENKPTEPTPAQIIVPNDAEITARIRGIVAKILNLDSNSIDVNAPLTKQKNPADELDIIEIIMEVEEIFNIEIKDEEIGNSTEQVVKELSVKKLAEIVAKKKTGKPVR